MNCKKQKNSKIKLGLECCTKPGEGCGNCPYQGESPECITNLLTDVNDLIKEKKL